MAFPIENKQDLIDALKELSDSELSEANLQKKGSVDPSSPQGKQRTQQLKEEAELRKRIADSIGDIQKSNRAALEIEKQLLQQLDLTELALSDRLELNEKELEIAKQLEELTGRKIADTNDLIKAEEEINRKLKISNKEGEKYRNTFESIATHIGMSNRGAAKLVNSTKALAEDLKDNAEKQAEFARAFVSTFNVTNAIAAVFTSFAESMVRNLMMLDQVASNFAAATGAGRGFTGVIQEAQANSRRFNVTLEESGNATQALFEGFIGFTNASKGTQIALAETTAQLGKFGVDGQSAVNLLNFFSANLGKSTEESAALTKELAMMGPKIGVSTAKITRDFQSALPTLAVYGDKSIDVFQGLAGAARMASIETSKLLDLANKFDTFAGSAETAGKLNAILGTQISAMEMLNMKENERIESLISSVQATGVAFKDLGRFEQKAIAAAAGISDLSEAQRIFGMSLSAFRQQQVEMDKSAKVQEEFNKALKDVIKFGEKFQALFARFVPVITPALDLIHSVADALANLVDQMSPETQRLVGQIIIGLSGFVVVLSLIAPLMMTLSSLATGLSAIGVVGPVASGGLAAIGTGLKALGSALASPQVILGLAAVTAAIAGLAYAYNLYQEQTTKQEEAKAKQIENNVALAQSFEKIGGNLDTLSMSTFEKPIAGLQAMAQALGQFQDVSVDARATLTNLALISAGKAADSANNARIVAAGAATINNNINNSFAPTMTLEIDGEQFTALVKDIQYNTANATG